MGIQWDVVNVMRIVEVYLGVAVFALFGVSWIEGYGKHHYFLTGAAFCGTIIPQLFRIEPPFYGKPELHKVQNLVILIYAMVMYLLCGIMGTVDMMMVHFDARVGLFYQCLLAVAIGILLIVELVYTLKGGRH